ncbi:MAG TPA: TonB family protein [Methylomirabilota bacterium]|nr:TonB family protein [Methylomirabilota bacterium]
MRGEPLSVPLLSSCFIHVVVILAASLIIHNSRLLRKEFVPISLVDLPPKAKEIPIQKAEVKPEIKKPPPPPPKIEKVPEVKRQIVQPEQPAPPPIPAPVKEQSEPRAVPAPSQRVESGGSEAGAGNLFGKGDVGVVPGSGFSGGGGGTANAGLGRGSGAPGLPAPAQPGILKTNREAKPIQSARATYPPLALRMGIEGDVTLRIEVDPEGKVTKAEITKSGGAGFDEEALKAVKQSRFEPAQRDGQNVAAEFTYVYRFRLAR